MARLPPSKPKFSFVTRFKDTGPNLKQHLADEKARVRRVAAGILHSDADVPPLHREANMPRARRR